MKGFHNKLVYFSVIQKLAWNKENTVRLFIHY